MNKILKLDGINNQLPRNPNIDWGIIDNNLNRDWDWEVISKQAYINDKIVMDNLHRPWDWDSLSMNPNITPELVIKNPDRGLAMIEDKDGNNLDLPPVKWNIYRLIGNSMQGRKREWIYEYRVKIIKAFQIQRHWRNCISNPEFKLARKVINRMLNSD